MDKYTKDKCIEIMKKFDKSQGFMQIIDLLKHDEGLDRVSYSKIQNKLKSNFYPDIKAFRKDIKSFFDYALNDSVLDQTYSLVIKHYQSQFLKKIQKINPLSSQSSIMELKKLQSSLDAILKEPPKLWLEHLRPLTTIVPMKTISPSELYEQLVKIQDEDKKLSIFNIVKPFIPPVGKAVVSDPTSSSIPVVIDLNSLPDIALYSLKDYLSTL